MATLEQRRAALAHEHVSRLLSGDEAAKKKYATMVHKFPALLLSAGLCQALHFVHSRSDESQRQLLDHMATQLNRVDAGITSRDSLLSRARDAELGGYLRLSHEATLCAAWYRRMVQGVLKVDAAESEE